MSETGAHLVTLKDLIAYESTPLEQRYPWQNSYDLIVQSCRKYPQYPALEFLPTAARDEKSISVSFPQLAERVHQTANLLHSIGVGHQDTVSILLPGLPETHFALWGSQAAGIASPINPLLEAGHIIDIMNETRTKVLITLGADYSAELWAKIEHIIARVPSLNTLLLISADEIPDVKTPATITVFNYSKAIAQQPADHLVSHRHINSNETAAYFHTGGTTGRPKIAQLTHGNIAFIAQAYADRTSDEGQFALLCGLPLFHIFGAVVAGISSLFAGRTLVMMTPQGFRSPNVIINWWHHIERFQVKGIAVVPTILSTLLQVPVGESDISCLEYVGCGAAPLSNSLKLEFEKKYNVCITNGYGMTETTSLIACQIPEFNQLPGSVGARLPYTEMQIAKVNGSLIVKTCQIGEVGVLLVRGPHIFAGYLNADDNATAWVDDGWFNTGDMGYTDEERNLFLTGRAKDLIIRGGHNIDPALIEESLAKHPAIAIAVAVGQPDAYAGELPIAYVTLKKGQEVTTEALIDYCKDSIAERAAIPKRIEIINEIPLTAVAKVFKPALRNRATEFVIKDLLSTLDINAEVTAEFDTKRGQIAKIALHNTAQKSQVISALESLPLLIEFI
ncbi:MAG: fatty-acyl-CoA synthase [Pseudohongiellaceae bacterium]|jgi:fatty-acyl-CoA synthase